MKPFQRVKLALCLGLVLLCCWLWLGGFFKWQGESADVLEWPEYAQEYLWEVLPENAGGFFHPIASPQNERAYLEQAFGEKNSTAEIWKLEPGGGSKKGQIVAMGDGLVLMAEDWGNDLKGVVVILHRVPSMGLGMVESLVAGLDVLGVKPGQWVRGGEAVGVIENMESEGLVWEVRDQLGLGLTPEYLENRKGWLSPSDFIKKGTNSSQ
jgi:murein DD-endopeptidase MepM/ murein hydrolase activator NlpD